MVHFVRVLTFNPAYEFIISFILLVFPTTFGLYPRVLQDFDGF